MGYLLDEEGCDTCICRATIYSNTNEDITFFDDPVDVSINHAGKNHFVEGKVNKFSDEKLVAVPETYNKKQFHNEETTTSTNGDILSELFHLSPKKDNNEPCNTTGKLLLFVCNYFLNAKA